MPKTNIQISTQFQATGTAAADVALGKVGAVASKAERDLLAYASTVAKAQRTQGDAAGAVKTYEAALSQVDRTSRQAIATEGQLAASIAQVQRQAQSASILPRTVESFGTEALGQIKSGLLGIVGPTALVAAGFAAVGRAIDLTEESFKLKAALDTTNLSIQLQLKNFRDVNQTIAEGQQFAHRYNITQEENAAAIQASIPLLRQSKSSLSDVEGVLSRLAVLKPEQGIQGAAFALAELEGGQSRSLATRFNIPIAKATELKNAIRDGGDAIQIMDAYLNSVGLDMSTLDVRTQGATGKMNALAVETENFKLALGGAAGGPGGALLDARIAVTANATRALSGDTKTLIQDFGGLAIAVNPLASALAIVSTVDDALIAKFNTLAGTSFPGFLDPLKDSITQWGRLIGVIQETPAGIPNADRLKDDLVGIARDAHAAAAAILEIPGSGANPNQGAHIADRSPSVGGGVGGLGDLLTKGGTTVAARQRRADQQASQLQDVQFDNQLKKAKDNAAKIALLRQKEAGTTDPIERARIEGQIIDLQNQKNNGLQKELNLNERIYDSVTKQKDALLDIEELTIKDRQADRDAAAKNRTAQAIIKATEGRTDARALDFRARAEDVIALNSVEDRQRAQAIAEKQATAGGTISASGKLLQSVPNAGGPVVSAPAGAASAGGPLNTPQPAAAAGAGSAITVNVIVDGKAAWSGMAPYAWDEFIHAVRVQ